MKKVEVIFVYYLRTLRLFSPKNRNKTMGNASSDRNKCPHKKDTPTSPTTLAKRQEMDQRIVADIVKKNLFVEEWKLTPEQKQHLQTSWVVLRANLESIGVVTLLKLFETHPETLRPFIQEVYSLKELELNEWYREKLRVHALRVMSVVEKTIHRLNEEVKAGQILIGYGRHHMEYGATLSMLDLMGKCFVISIQPTLEDASCWSRAVEASWVQMFRFITFFMKVGYGDLCFKCETDQDGELHIEYVKEDGAES